MHHVFLFLFFFFAMLGFGAGWGWGSGGGEGGIGGVLLSSYVHALPFGLTDVARARSR